MISTTERARKKLRSTIRHERNKLSNNFQRQASEILTQQLIQLPIIKSANILALYLSNDGELNPKPFIEWCWQQQKQIVLPILHPFRKGHLLFLKYESSTLMQHNRFGIPEPIIDVNNIIPVNVLDIIFTPLVAFDRYGQRLGMGGGFYDRTLALLTHNKSGTNTFVMGLAHDCQEVTQIPVKPWDVPIKQIITPTRILIAENNR